MSGAGAGSAATAQLHLLALANISMRIVTHTLAVPYVVRRGEKAKKMEGGRALPPVELVPSVQPHALVRCWWESPIDNMEHMHMQCTCFILPRTN